MAMASKHGLMERVTKVPTSMEENTELAHLGGQI